MTEKEIKALSEELKKYGIEFCVEKEKQKSEGK